VGGTRHRGLVTAGPLPGRRRAAQSSAAPWGFRPTIGPMEILFLLIVVAIGGVMLRLDYTLNKLSEKLEEVSHAMRPREFAANRNDQP
jgi:hypothetical protein